MKIMTIAGVAAGIFAVSALGSTGLASAVPTSGSAADVVVSTLQSQGYTVALNGAPNGMQLSRCSVAGLHGLTVVMTADGALAMPMNAGGSDTVCVDLLCPSSNN